MTTRGREKQMKTRAGTRPYRASTLLAKDHPGPGTAFPSGSSEGQETATTAFAESLAGDAGEEFQKEGTKVEDGRHILMGYEVVNGKLIKRPPTEDELLMYRKANPQQMFESYSGRHEPATPENLDEAPKPKLAAAEPGLKTELLPHQERVVERMRGQPGLVVAHGTGSGKTLSSIGAMVDLGPQKARVVVPASLKENYAKEVKKHVKGGLPVEVESLQKAVKDGNPPRADLLVVDEAHRVRNPKSKGYQMLRDSKAQKRMLLTASPVYNLPEDVAPLVNIAAGGKELPEGADFRKRYVQKPGKGLLTLLNPWAQRDPKIVRKGELSQVLNRWVDYHGGSEEGFPELTERRINVPMTRRQTKLHAAAWGRLPLLTRMRLKKGLPPDKKDLARLNKFQAQTRQISSSEKKYVQEGVVPEPSPKVLAAVDSLQAKAKANPQHRALVYANYLGTLDDYSDQLNQRGIPHASFRGDMSKKEREQNVRNFNAGKVKALLVSGAGGEGLDLAGTRQVQVLEPHWNEERLRQVIGRARRFKSHDHLPPAERKVDVERYAARPLKLFGGMKKGVEDILYDTAEQKQRLNNQLLSMLTKTSAEVVMKKPREFAPGIPGNRGIKSIPTVKETGGNQDWTASLSHHPAERRGDHHDLRLVDPKGRAHSWAFKDVPDPGKSIYAVQQPTHSKEYALRTKPFAIPPGYGATRPGAKVEPKFVNPVEVVESGQDKVRFLRHRGQQSEEYVLRRLTQAMGDSRPLWALHNATKNRGTIEGKKIPDYKPRYNEVAPDQIDVNDPNTVMQAKLDGAHAIVSFPRDRMRRVFSYRPTARKTGLIEHTFKFPGFQKQKTPEGLENTMIRAELYGTGPEGKAIPSEQLAGILNSGVPKSRQKQEEKGVKLRLAGIDVIRHGGKRFDNKPFADKLEVLRQVSKATKGAIELPPTAVTPAAKRKLLAQIESKSLPQTEEGVVLHDMSKAAPPTKAVFKPDHDVYVRKVFTKERGAARGHAGGFEYSWTPDGPVVGKVGTGFDHKTRKDMMQNPEKYVGRVAKVQSAKKYQNRQDPSQVGALKTPAFKGWHVDKSDPELMKEASAWSKKLRHLIHIGDFDTAGQLYAKMKRMSGYPVSAIRSAKDVMEEAAQKGTVDEKIKSLRGLMAEQPTEIAPKGSEAWREAMRDIKEGRMTPLESGLSRAQGESIQQFGPSTYITGGHKGQSKRLKEFIRRYNEADEYGIYTAPQGTRRTFDYAMRQAEREGPEGIPAHLSFEVPRSLVEQTPGKEQVVPRSVFQQWARKVRLGGFEKGPGEKWTQTRTPSFEKASSDEQLSKLSDLRKESMGAPGAAGDLLRQAFGRVSREVSPARIHGLAMQSRAGRALTAAERAGLIDPTRSHAMQEALKSSLSLQQQQQRQQQEQQGGRRA